MNSEGAASRPMPKANPDTKPYWEGLQQGRLLLQRCADCGRLRHYPRPVCDACHSMKADWIQASGYGVVHTWTIAHRAFHPAFHAELPCVLVTVDLEEGVRMLGPLRGADPASLKLSLPVRVIFEPQSDGIVLPAFALREAR